MPAFNSLVPVLSGNEGLATSFTTELSDPRMEQLGIGGLDLASDDRPPFEVIFGWSVS